MTGMGCGILVTIKNTCTRTHSRQSSTHAHTHTHTELRTALCSCFTVANTSEVGLALEDFRDKCERQRLDTKHTDNLHVLLNAVPGEQNWYLARE